MIMAMAKPLMEPSMRASILMGCQIIENEESRTPFRRLKDFYFQPNAQVAYLNLLERAKVLIAMRQHNEESFRL